MMFLLDSITVMHGILVEVNGSVNNHVISICWINISMKFTETFFSFHLSEISHAFVCACLHSD